MIPAPADEAAVRALYRDVLESWNRRDARGMASLFADRGQVIGFDGSQMAGPGEIEGALGRIFANHATPTYVAIVRDARLLASEVAVLQAVVGMVPAGETDLDPALNAIQTLVAARRDGRWRAEVLQNTPAAFHGRPEARAALTRELRAVLQNRRADR